MNISAFSNYKVSFNNQYSYISDYEYNEPTYSAETEKWEKEMDGGTFMNFVAELMLNGETISVISKENTIFIETFCPHNGTGADIVIKYEEIKESKE